jgi:hypothetical protein
MGRAQVDRAVVDQAEVGGATARGPNQSVPEDRRGLRTKLRHRMHIIDADLSMKAVGNTEYL